MGQLTFTEIVSEGLLMAGDSRLATRAGVWLNSWLRSQYSGFPWPFLLRSTDTVSLASGAASFDIGSGEGGVTEMIRRVIDPVWVYNTAKTVKQQVRIHSAVETDVTNDLTINSASTHKGLPTQARIYAAQPWGRWTVKFDKWADRNLLVKLSYYILPMDVSGANVPLYPNDRTMMKAVEAEALRFKKDPNAMNELQILSSMVVDDRLKFGEIPGQNDYFDLDRTVFR